MATIEVENATVTRLIEGYGFEVREDIQLKSGDTITKYFTVWNKSVKPQVGDVVRVQGDFSAKIDEYTGKDNVPKRKLSVSINNAEVMVETADAPF